jgi:hypothetical protein
MYPVSGKANLAADVENPDMKVISKPARCTSLADKASKQHGMVWRPGFARSLRRRAADDSEPDELAIIRNAGKLDERATARTFAKLFVLGLTHVEQNELKPWLYGASRAINRPASQCSRIPGSFFFSSGLRVSFLSVLFCPRRVSFAKNLQESGMERRPDDDPVALDIVISSDGKSEFFREGLVELYKTETLCDLTICVKAMQPNHGWAKIKAHKVVMAAVSPVLRKMLTTKDFAESVDKDEVQFGDLDEETVMWIMEFVYRGSVRLEDGRSLLKIYQAADQLDIPSLREVSRKGHGVSIHVLFMFQVMTF